MAGDRTFVVKFISDTASAKAGLKLLSGDIKGFGSQVSKTSPLFGALAVGATAAFGAIAVGLTKAVKAAMEDQKSQVELQRQLEKTFGANELLTASAERYISVTQLRTGTSDTELRASLGTLVRATGDLTQSQNLLNLAQDISAATGKDLSSVSLALAKASQGQFTALSKLGIPLDENTKKSKDFGKVVGLLNDQFGGAAETAANTFAGKLKILQGQFGEIIETVGAALLPYLDKFATFLVKTVAPAVERITFVIGKYGLAAGFQQLVFESGKAGPAIIGVVRGITIAFATLVNVVYKAVQLQIAQFKILKGDFGGALDALKNTTKDLINVGALEKAFNKIAFGFNYAESTALDLAASLDGLGYKIPKVKKSAEDLGDDNKGLGKVTKTLKYATEKLDEYNKSLDVSKRLQDRLTKAGKSESGALASLTDANTRLANAKARLAQIESGFGAGSPEALAAQAELAKAQRGQERATYAVEEAIYSVADAEKNLADVRKDPESSPMDIRRAELDLAEAKLSVADSIDAQIDATKELNDQQTILNETIFGATVGSILYDEALKDVTDAFNDQVSAFEDWEEAVTNTKIAQDEFNKSLQETIDLILKYPKVLSGMPTFEGLLPPPSKGARFNSFMDAVAALHPNSETLKSATPFADSKAKFPKLFADFEAGKLIAMAKGGLVKNPMAALIGEAGPELVIPLKDLNGLGGQTVNIIINSAIAEQGLPNKIVEALQQYNRSVGKIPVTTK
jgi:hypothetical protein